MTVSQDNKDDSGNFCGFAEVLTTMFSAERAFQLPALRRDNRRTCTLGEQMLIFRINDNKSVFWHLLIFFRFKIITVHFNLPARGDFLQFRGNHVNLLVDFYFLCCILTVVKHFFILDTVSQANLILET